MIRLCRFITKEIISDSLIKNGFLNFSTKLTRINSKASLRTIAIVIPIFLTNSCFSIGAFLDSNAIKDCQILKQPAMQLA